MTAGASLPQNFDCGGDRPRRPREVCAYDNSYGARLFTASANTPKRREQNLIVRSGRSEVEVRLTIEDCARRIVYTIEANYTDRHEASSGLSATAGLLVNVPQR